MNDDNDDIAQLLRQAGKRSQPAPEAMERMRLSTHAAWRRRLRERARRRWFAAAASVLLVVAAGALTWRSVGTSGDALVARITASAPSLELRRSVIDTLRDRDPQVLRTGDRLITGSDAGATLAQFPGGNTTLRLDRNTEVAWIAASELRVVRGSVYVDTGVSGDLSPPLTLLAGEVRIAHVGTRFMTRVDGNTVRVAVRDGRVRVERGADSLLAGRGEEVEVVLDGTLPIVGRTIATSGDHWEWADVLAPATPIEGRPLSQVLAALAWQSGQELRYGNAAIAAQAGDVILHGPALAMPPRTAIEAVIATTPFEIEVVAGGEGELRIVRAEEGA